MTGTSGKTVHPSDLINGAVLQIVEASTLGMPFEVWKTRMGRFNEGTMQSFMNIYKRGGPSAYWQGLAPKCVESGSKGAVLLFSKEAIFSWLQNCGVNSTISGFAAGAGGGVCQTVVMGPCTFVVTAMVTAKNAERSVVSVISDIWKKQGWKGFYSGSSAIAFRQASNWASRQGLTEFFRKRLQVWNSEKGRKSNLSVGQEALCGILGGGLSCWNHPFEVARIQMQARANESGGKDPKLSMLSTWRLMIKDGGLWSLYRGIIPRLCLGIWQTLFMVSGAKVLKKYLLDDKSNPNIPILPKR
eukprot:Filipodium_phascolosomae@DN5673_c0_g1_i1.p1